MVSNINAFKLHIVMHGNCNIVHTCVWFTSQYYSELEYIIVWVELTMSMEITSNEVP